MKKSREITGAQYLLFDLAVSLLELALYALCLAGPLALLARVGLDSPWLLLAIGAASAPCAAVTFVLLLVLLRRGLAPKIPEGRYFRNSGRAVPWTVAQVLKMIAERSPFLGWINGNIVLRQLYYRGMGARLALTAYTAPGVRIIDPWALKAGPHTLFGQEAIVSGHKIEHNVVSLEPVELGAGVLVGARAMIHPGVKIGDRAIVAAGAVVVRGTVIPAGETWAGNPARRVEIFGVLERAPAEAAIQTLASNAR